MKRNAIVGPNPIHPNYLTAGERIDELAENEQAKARFRLDCTPRLSFIEGSESGEVKEWPMECSLSQRD